VIRPAPRAAPRVPVAIDAAAAARIGEPCEGCARDPSERIGHAQMIADLAATPKPMRRQ
jgi:hypothetical protein